MTARPVDPRLRALEPLVGAWTITGDATGETEYTWMDGGHFLIQRGTLQREGSEHRFLEIIGFVRPFDATDPPENIVSRVYTTDGDTLDYVYELGGANVTIWGGQKGSPAAFRGRWEQHGDVLRGAWTWPGGGYETVMTRQKP